METIALDILKENGSSIASQENVLFDKILLQKGAVHYDITTGIVTLNKNGRYMVSWDVVTQAAVGSQTVRFGIKVSNNQEIITGSPVKNGQIVGFGIVQVESAPVTLSITNYENITVYYSVPPAIKAHMSIGELLETTGGQPTVWESAGVQLTNNSPQPLQQLSIPTGGTIPFDNITVQFNGVNYYNNAIQIIETGTYLVSWDVTAKAANSTSNLLVFLEDSFGNVHGKSGMYGGTLAPTVGSTLVQVTSLPGGNPFTLKLINRTDTDILLASMFNGSPTTTTHFAGSLTVVKVADLYYT